MEKKYELKSEAKAITSFRTKLRRLLQKAGLDEKKAGEVVLAVDEGLANICRYAYLEKPGKIFILFRDEKDRIEVWIRDSGKKFDPSKVPAPELPPAKPGGLGIYFMKSLMDRVVYEEEYREGNLLKLVKFKK